jgi:hypothetical protein
VRAFRLNHALHIGR